MVAAGPLTQQELTARLEQVQQWLHARRFNRWLRQPLRYLSAIWFREVVYRRTRQAKEVKACTFFGQSMYVLLPSATDIYLTGAKTHDSEIRLAKFLVAVLQPGHTFVDIGAHYGYYSLLAAQRVGPQGKVFCFEAAPETYKMLQKNVAHCANIESVHAVVAREAGWVDFFVFPNLFAEYNAIDVTAFANEPWFGKNKPKPVPIPALVLDDFLEQKAVIPHVIKLDVEGAEYRVLSGCRRLLQRATPIIAMEYFAPHRNNEEHCKAEQLLRDFGYRSFLIDHKGALQEVDSVAKVMQACRAESDNVVFKKK